MSASDGVTTPLPVSQDGDLMDILAVAVFPPQSFAPVAASAAPLQAPLPNPYLSRSPSARPPSSGLVLLPVARRALPALHVPAVVLLLHPVISLLVPRLVSHLVSFAQFLRTLTIPLRLMDGLRAAPCVLTWMLTLLGSSLVTLLL